MSGKNIYYDLVTILRNAGCTVKQNGTTDGWQRRARSSGGFPAPPLGVWWHHTASKTSPESDLQWMINSSSDAPIGNILIDRTGACWPIAGGASNTAGKGGPAKFSRGTVAVDSGNTGGFQIEVANNGVGEAWPQPQIDAFFRASNALNAAAGNLPTDVITHNVWAPTRKIDPATASAVQGPWRPRSVNSSGTWNLQDIAAECQARFGGIVPPEDDDMTDAQFNEMIARLDTIAFCIAGNSQTGQVGIAQQLVSIHDAQGVLGEKLDNIAFSIAGNSVTGQVGVTQQLNSIFARQGDIIGKLDEIIAGT